MSDVLIIAAHPEPSSFTLDWARASLAAAQAAGHRAHLCDLYAEGFDPAEGPAHYPGLQGPFDPLKAQEAGGQGADIKAMIAQVRRADLVVFHFPIWWFGPPAMLKGWFDRVLAHGQLHDVDNRFDRGPCRGKRALFCVSTGASEAECGPDGKEGNLRYLLWPLAYALRYCGFDVAEPAAVHSVHGYWSGVERDALEDRLRAALDAQAGVLEGIARRTLWPFHPDAAFDAEGRLKPGEPGLWPFIQPRSEP